MFRRLIIFTVALLVISGGNAKSEELQKCNDWLKFAYDYFVQQGAFKLTPQIQDSSALQMDSSALQMDSSSFCDSVKTNKKQIDSADTNNSLSERIHIITSKSGEDFEVIEVDDVDDSDPHSIENPNLYYEAGIPQVRVIIELSGDGSDLIALGANICCHYSSILIAWFPLSILPQIDALSTVFSISSGATVRDLSTENIKSAS